MAMRPAPSTPVPTAAPPTAQPSGAPTGMGAATEPSDDEGPESNVTPEEAAQYEKFLGNFQEVVYGKTGRAPGKNGEPSIFDTLMNTLQTVEDPIDALAVASVRVVSFLADSAEQAGKPVPHEILLHAATEIIPDLAEFAEALGVHDDYTEKELAMVLQRASLMYADELKQQGRLDENAMKGAADELIAADQAGTLEGMLPGMKQASEELGAEIPPEEILKNQQSAPQPQQPPQGMGQAMRPRNG